MDIIKWHIDENNLLPYDLHRFEVLLKNHGHCLYNLNTFNHNSFFTYSYDNEQKSNLPKHGFYLDQEFFVYFNLDFNYFKYTVIKEDNVIKIFSLNGKFSIHEIILNDSIIDYFFYNQYFYYIKDNQLNKIDLSKYNNVFKFNLEAHKYSEHVCSFFENVKKIVVDHERNIVWAMTYSSLLHLTMEGDFIYEYDFLVGYENIDWSTMALKINVSSGHLLCVFKNEEIWISSYIYENGQNYIKEHSSIRDFGFFRNKYYIQGDNYSTDYFIKEELIINKANLFLEFDDGEIYYNYYLNKFIFDGIEYDIPINDPKMFLVNNFVFLYNAERYYMLELFGNKIINYVQKEFNIANIEVINASDKTNTSAELSIIEL